MIDVVGIRFSHKGRLYYFNRNGLDLKKDMLVIVNTERGEQLGFVYLENQQIEEDKLVNPLKNVLRIATDKDKKIHEKNLIENEYALKKARELVAELNLNMKILDASFTFDRKQLLFNFVADDRIDFRELAKRLASIYRTRIELRQIGIRDKAREIGGLGPCGRFLCCSTFLTNFDTVSISMAKNQGLALNPTKINGVCGRLLCCLNYENEQYLEARKDIPDVGKKVMINGKEGKVITSEPLLYKYKVLVDDELIEVDKNDSTK